MPKTFPYPLADYMAMTPAEVQSLEDYCDSLGLELCLIGTGWLGSERQLAREFQKDKDEDREAESLGGQRAR